MNISRNDSSYNNNNSLNDGACKIIVNSDTVKILLSCYWTLAMILSIVGNASTCAIICRDRALRTSTNFYLFNLAFIDLIITVFIPNEIYLLWTERLYPYRYSIYQFLFLYFLTNLSVLTITSLTIERYLVITKPFLRRTLTSKYRVLKIIIGLWVIMCCYSGFGLIKLLSTHTYIASHLSYCTTILDTFNRTFLAIDMLLFFLIPLFIIIILYLLIVIKLKSMKSNDLNRTSSLNNNKVIKVLGAVAGIFFFCWSPSFAFRGLLLTSYNDFAGQNIMRTLHYVCSITVYTSIAINPVMYYTMSSRFRESYKDLFRKRNRSESSGQGNETREIA